MSPIAIVTGSEGGLGTALCRAFQAAGYRVVGTDRRRGGSACDAFVELDLAAVCASPAALAGALDALRAPLAGDGVAALVHNAAVQRLGGLEAMSLGEWQETLAVNVTAPLFLTRGLLPDLERGAGSVVHVGSVHARATKPGFVAYAASKAALAGLTRALAVDLGPRVRVNAVQPAAIDTPMLAAGFEGRADARAGLAAMHPIGRIAEPDEVAAAVVFLASDRARFITGAVLDVDGGILARLHDPV